MQSFAILENKIDTLHESTYFMLTHVILQCGCSILPLKVRRGHNTGRFVIIQPQHKKINFHLICMNWVLI